MNINNLEEYRQPFLDHLTRFGLSVKDEAWADGKFLNNDVQFFFSLYCITITNKFV